MLLYRASARIRDSASDVTSEATFSPHRSACSEGSAECPSTGAAAHSIAQHAGYLSDSIRDGYPAGGADAEEIGTLRVLLNADPQKVRRDTANLFLDKNSNPRVSGISFHSGNGGVKVIRDISSNPDILKLGEIRDGVQTVCGIKDGVTFLEVGIAWRETGWSWPQRKEWNVAGFSCSLETGDSPRTTRYFLRKEFYDQNASGGGFILLGR